MNGFFFRRNFDLLHPLQLFDPALHLLGLGGLIAEAIDERLKLVDLFFLVGVRGLQLRAALRFLRQIFLVIAGIEEDLLVPYFSGLLHRDVKKITVVRDQHVGMRIIDQILLQPVAGFKIKMVRRLVQQKQVGLLQQQLGQRNAHLPAAGKLFRPPLPVFFLEAQAIQHRAHFSFNGVTIAGLHLRLYAMEALGNLLVLRAGVIDFSHATRQLFLLTLHLVHVLKDGEAFGKNGAPGKRKPSCGR